MISNLTELINLLETDFNSKKDHNNCSIEFLKTHIEKYVGIDWRHYADLKKNFNRNIIYRSKNMELILISWQKDYETDYHLHPENGCLLRILEGSLMENIKDEESNKMNFYGNNNVSYMHNSKGSHKITALTQTFSLHLYSPPGYYDLKKNV
jgi:hypothetical protein